VAGQAVRDLDTAPAVWLEPDRGAAYDPRAGMIYLSEQHGDGSDPVILAYRIVLGAH